MTITQYVVQWTGGRIGLGASVFHIGVSSPAGMNWANVNTAFGAWFTALRASTPNEVSWTFPFEVKTIDEATGALTGVFSIPQRASITGQDASTNWSSSSGRVVKWSTGAVVGGRRLSGHTYLVPSGGSAMSEGSVQNTIITSDGLAHAALISSLAAESAPLVVWSRAHGAEALVTGGATLARPSTLRSRND
jgi:hypothetical protein